MSLLETELSSPSASPDRTNTSIVDTFQRWKQRAMSSLKVKMSSPYTSPDERKPGMLETLKAELPSPYTSPYGSKIGMLKAFWRTVMVDSIAPALTDPCKGGSCALNEILFGYKPTAGSWYGRMVDILTNDRLPQNVESIFKGIEPSEFDDLARAVEVAVAR
jgi:hypothetical protein